jgi:hypothetical protein
MNLCVQTNGIDPQLHLPMLQEVCEKAPLFVEMQARAKCKPSGVSVTSDCRTQRSAAESPICKVSNPVGISCKPFSLNPGSPDPVVVRANPHIGKACASQIRLDLLRSGVLRHVWRTISGRQCAMRFENLPTAIGAKIYVININPTLGSQNTKRLQNIVISVP